MYSPQMVAYREERLLRTKPSFRALFPQGVPTYSLDDSRALTSQIVRAMAVDGSPIRTLTPEEEAFISATKTRVTFDYEYWASRFAYIDEEGHGLRPLYPLWESQRFVLDLIGRIEWERHREGHPDGILVNALKARQLGVSTEAESLVAHRILTRPHIRALSGADVEEQAGYLFRMVNRIYDHLPYFLQPQRLTFVKNRESSYANGSFLKTAWGKSTRGALQSVTGQEGSKGALGRGQTFSCVHISELATWDNPSQLDSALLKAVPVSPQTLVIFESTAEHAGDWWHQHWLVSGSGDSRFTNIFIPWYAEPSKYSLPAPWDWTPNRQTVEHGVKCELDSPKWFNGKTVTLTRDQLYWYERERRAHEKKGAIHIFLKEMPADDLECFQYAGRSIFTHEQLEAIDRAGSQRKLLDVWRVEPAREIAALRRVEVPDPTERRKPAPLTPILTAANAHETHPIPPGYGFSRVGRDELAVLPSLRGSVMAIWEFPRPRGPRRYVMSVDVADGLGQDYSVVDVIRMPTVEEPAEQVAQYVSNRIAAKDLAFVCDAIGRFYMDGEGIEALAAIETNNCGSATQGLLQLHLGYSNFYVREIDDAALSENRFSSKIGWLTTARTRPLLLASFHAAITTVDAITNQPDLILNSPITRGELRHLVTEGTLGEAEAARGQHDDAIMSAAIGFYVAYRLSGGELEPVAEKRRRRSALHALAEEKGQTAGLDWRNMPVTAEEADHGHEEDDDTRDERCTIDDSFFH